MGLADYKTRLMKRLQALLQKLAKAGVAELIVIRPHPFQNHDVWREWAADIPNVAVRHAVRPEIKPIAGVPPIS